MPFSAAWGFRWSIRIRKGRGAGRGYLERKGEPRVKLQKGWRRRKSFRRSVRVMSEENCGGGGGGGNGTACACWAAHARTPKRGGALPEGHMTRGWP